MNKNTIPVYNWGTLDARARKSIITRPKFADLEAVRPVVRAILDNVARDGDNALRSLTAEFDGIDQAVAKLDADAIKVIAKKASGELLAALKVAFGNIYKYHEATKPKNGCVQISEGIRCDYVWQPLATVGLYIPGGSAPLVSTALMLAIPAKIAGCARIIVVTPPDSCGGLNPDLAAAFDLCGVDEVYLVGGAQAIGALAYGTVTVPKVGKIFGPGNQYVNAAKILVAGETNGTDIDLPAGPSEVMVIIDGNSDPAFAAWDVLAQLEHGPASQAIIVGIGNARIDEILAVVCVESELSSRKDVLQQSINNLVVITVDSAAEAIDVANAYAPEHLIILPELNQPTLNAIVNAGSVFVGPYAPEALGDYATGSNHVLPTGGAALTRGGLATADFMKRISIQRVTRAGFLSVAGTVETLATAEGLPAHAKSVSTRRRGFSDVN